jgi:hypothetical protein
VAKGPHGLRPGRPLAVTGQYLALYGQVVVTCDHLGHPVGTVGPGPKSGPFWYSSRGVDLRVPNGKSGFGRSGPNGHFGHSGPRPVRAGTALRQMAPKYRPGDHMGPSRTPVIPHTHHCFLALGKKWNLAQMAIEVRKWGVHFASGGECWGPGHTVSTGWTSVP